MKTARFILASSLILLSGCTGRELTREAVKKEILSRFARLEGEFALAFKNLDEPGEEIMINGREMFHAASTMKTPVMIELYRQAHEGKFALDDSVVVKNEFRSIVDGSRYSLEIAEDSDEVLYTLIGQKSSIRDLVEAMITTSSNLATNILVAMAGADNVTQTMRSYGADSIRVLRGVEDLKAYERGLNNRTSARDLMTIFEKPGRGKAVSSGASSAMVEILKKQEFNEMIPARLPEGVGVAHKTGWITGIYHDSGLVMLPDGRRYVLVLLSKNAPDREATVGLFSGISRLIYDYVTATSG